MSIQQELLIQSIINSLKKIPNLNKLNLDVSKLQSECTEMVGATADLDGESGLVPKPLTTDKDKFLSGDGTWKKIDIDPELLDQSIEMKSKTSAYDLLNSYIVMDSGMTVGKVKSLYKSSSMRFTQYSDDDRTVLLSLGKADAIDPINTGIELVKNKYTFQVLPPLNPVSNNKLRLPSLPDTTEATLVTNLDLLNYYTQTQTDSAYLNKTTMDTLTSGVYINSTSNYINAFGSVFNVVANGRSVISVNDNGTTFYGSLSGSATSAYRDSVDNKPFESKYAKLNDDVTFNTIVSTGQTTIGGTRLMPTTISRQTFMTTSNQIVNSNALLNQASFCYRNMSAGTGTDAPPSAYGVSGSVYLQYT